MDYKPPICCGQEMVFDKFSNQEYFEDYLMCRKCDGSKDLPDEHFDYQENHHPKTPDCERCKGTGTLDQTDSDGEEYYIKCPLCRGHGLAKEKEVHENG